MAEPPELLFLQNRLSGLSAEILCRHIRNQLSDTSRTAIIVLSESTGDTPEEVTIVTAVTDEQLAAAITDVISKAATAAGDTVPLPPEVPSSTVPPDGEPAGEDSVPPEPRDTVTLGETTDPPSEVHLPPLKFQEELDCLIGTSSPAPLVEDANSISPIAGKKIDELLRHPSPSRGSRRLTVLGVVVAIAAAILLFLATRGAPPTSAPGGKIIERESGGNVAKDTMGGLPSPGATGNRSVTTTAVVSAPPTAPAPAETTKRTELPKFIPREAFVKGYGDTNPGWERYVTSDLEFRVFRKGREIKALQAIDRTGKGMSRSFFTRAILEMADARDYRLLSKEVKGEYLVKKGALSANAAVILYKKKDDTQLKAFVIHYQ